MRKPPHDAERYRVRTGFYGSDASYGNAGLFQALGPCGMTLRMIASDEGGWEHVSVSLANRCPNWREMCWVKELFWEDHEAVMQLHPPKADYVNHHPYCLHLWRPLKAEIPRPPAIMVGVKDMSAPTEEERKAMARWRA